MKFVNRHQELSRLNHLMRQSTAAAAVIWGRRRVGKSRLLLEWICKHKGVYYMADESTSTIQRQYFARAIAQRLPNFAEVEYPDWAALFSRLAREAVQAKWRGPLIIDELPYLIASSPELPSVLQRFIDTEAKEAKLIIALCGSSQKMMQGAILEPTSPLYGRAHEVLKLRPISIGYLGEALKLRKGRAIVESYTIWGGIPRYWELAQKSSGSFSEQVDKIVLDPMGPLHEEPNRLLLEESAMSLRSILDAIGQGNHRLSEVGNRTGLSSTSMMRPLHRLMELDLIQREHPFGSDENNSKKTLYKIKDPFLRFWFNVVAPRRSWLAQASASLRIQMLKEVLPALFSATWEELCRMAVPFLGKKLGVETFGTAARYWQGQEVEWDILAESQNGNSMLIGEAKWFLRPPSLRTILTTASELRNKGIPPINRQSNGKIIYALFVPEKPKNLILPPDVKVIDAKEVIKALR
jgi:uncharacterized protein